jgi:hypothetical protein
VDEHVSFLLPWGKGNSGWGRVHWVMENARGQCRIACGARIQRADVDDCDGRVSISFDGWNFLGTPIIDKSSIPDLSTGLVDNLWEFGEVHADEIALGTLTVAPKREILGRLCFRCLSSR